MIKQILKNLICSFIYRCGSLFIYNKLFGKGKISVLMYHKIDDSEDILGLTIKPSFFERQIQYLVDNYEIIRLGRAASLLENGAMDKHYIVITFDDGYRDNYLNAYPILQRYNVPATIFVSSDAIEKGVMPWNRLDNAIFNSASEPIDLSVYGFGRISLGTKEEKNKAVKFFHRKLKKIDDKRHSEIIEDIIQKIGHKEINSRIMLTWDEIQEMAKSNLVTIGSHTISHPILTRISKDQARAEVFESKKIIEKKINRPVGFFAYPNGGKDDFNEEIMNMVRESGYKGACSTIPGINRKDVNKYSLHRTDVTYGICRNLRGSFSKSLFAVKISGMLDGILFRY